MNVMSTLDRISREREQNRTLFARAKRKNTDDDWVEFDIVSLYLRFDGLIEVMKNGELALITEDEREAAEMYDNLSNDYEIFY